MIKLDDKKEGDDKNKKEADDDEKECRREAGHINLKATSQARTSPEGQTLLNFPRIDFVSHCFFHSISKYKKILTAGACLCGKCDARRISSASNSFQKNSETPPRHSRRIQKLHHNSRKKIQKTITNFKRRLKKLPPTPKQFQEEELQKQNIRRKLTIKTAAD